MADDQPRPLPPRDPRPLFVHWAIDSAVVFLLTVIVAIFSAWSLWVLRRTGSIRMSAVALFTCFLAGFIVLTAMGSIFRGPNWHFYWWPSQWPTH